MQAACLWASRIPASLVTGKPELSQSPLNKETEMQCATATGISASLPGFMRGHNSVGLLLLLMADRFERQPERFGSGLPSHRKLLRLAEKGYRWWRQPLISPGNWRGF